MTKKTIVTALLVLVTLLAPLSVYSQSQDFQMNGTVLVEYRGSAANVTIPEGVTSIGGSAFYDCTSLTSITIPSSVTSIGNHAFYGCTSLASVTIPSSVTSIGAWAFSRCTSLASVTIPSSVTSIGELAFYNTAWFNNQPNNLVYAGKVLYKYEGTMPANTAINNIRADTIAIADRAFSVCTNLTSITIPSSVTSIGNRAFYGCDSLTSVTIPSSVTSVGYRAFNNCNNLRTVVISRRTTIGQYAFPTSEITYSD